MPRLHVWLVVFIAATAAQLAPVPPAILDRISPMTRVATAQLALVVPSWLTISIDDPATGLTLLVNLALVIVFLVSLRIFATAGVRLFTRGVAMMGLLLALIALAQDSTAHGLMYWRWKPLSEGSPPFGPFVNRNHFATWVVLALPLTIGYLAAHTGAHQSRTPAPIIPWRRRVVTFFDGRAALLTAAACMMGVALVATLSRSGLFGLAAAGAAAIGLRARRDGAGQGRAWWWLAAAAAGAVALTLAAISPDVIVARLARTQVSAADRLAIWRDTLPVIRDFWLTGTGAGTYETSMLVFQRASPG